MYSHNDYTSSAIPPKCMLLGTWSYGRLGLGPIPLELASKKDMRRGAKKAARYQLHSAGETLL